MSFFFNKSEGKDNLQYDDTAFLHFAISACSITALVFVGLIVRDSKRKGKGAYQKLSQIQYFKERVQKKQKS